MCTSQTTTRRRYPSRVSLGGFRKKHLEIVFCLLAGFRAAAPSLSNVMSKCQRPSILRAHGRRTARRHGMLPVAACCISRRSLGPFDLSVLSFVQTVAWAAPSEGPIVSAALNCVLRSSWPILSPTQLVAEAKSSSADPAATATAQAEPAPRLAAELPANPLCTGHEPCLRRRPIHDVD
jgi:hypothetical protein